MVRDHQPPPRNSRGASAKNGPAGRSTAKAKQGKRTKEPPRKAGKNMGFRGPLEQPPPPAQIAQPEQREAMQAAVTQAVAELDLDLVELEIKMAGTDWRVALSIDRQPGRGGITLDECGRASRRIASALDAIDGLSEIYELEVASPGMNRVLRGYADLLRYRGLTIKATIGPPQPESIVGVLIAVEGEPSDPLLTLRVGKAQPKKGITGKQQLQWSDLAGVHLAPTLPEWRDLGVRLAEEARQAGLPYAGGEEHDLGAAASEAVESPEMASRISNDDGE